MNQHVSGLLVFRHYGKAGGAGGRRALLHHLLFPQPPQAAKQAIRVNQKPLSMCEK